MKKFQAPSTEAEFIARCNKAADQERELARLKAIRLELDEIIVKIIAGDKSSYQGWVMTDLAEFMPTTTMDMIRCFDLAALRKALSRYNARASKICDAVEYEEGLLSNWVPTTMEGRFAVLRLGFEMNAPEGIKGNDYQITVARLVRQLASDQIPTAKPITRKAA